MLIGLKKLNQGNEVNPLVFPMGNDTKNTITETHSALKRQI